jgi:flagellin
MSRINTNVSSLLAQRNLATANSQVSKSLERLSTGLRINKGADDPAGLVASERMRSEKVALGKAISNSVRAANLLGTAEGALNEINTLLLDIQGMVDEAANEGGMTPDEVTANQLMLDEALSSIDRIAATTQFNGKKLLDGTLGFNTNTVAPLELSSVVVNQATFDGTAKAIAYNIDATTASQGLSNQTAVNLALADGLVRIEGNKGVAHVTFSAGMNQAQVMAAVNGVASLTGVDATANAATIDFTSSEYGLNQFVKFTRLNGAVFTVSADEDYGTNATVTAIDGSATGVSVEGLNVTVKRAALDLELIITDATVNTAVGTFNIEQGGAKFQIGAEINANNQVSMGIRNVGASYLGDAVNGFLDTLRDGGANDLDSTNFTTAAAILSTTINQVSSLRGRIGAVQKNTLETAMRSLGSTLENITSAESALRDTDFAAETANLTRAQILVQAGTSVLAMANSAPQNVLALLQG